MRDVISYSEWSLYKACPRRWALDYLRGGRRSDVRSIHLDFGSSIHKGLELLLSPSRATSVDTRALCEGASAEFERSLRELHRLNSALYGRKFDDVDKLVRSGRDILLSASELPELMGTTTLFNELKIKEEISRSDDIKMTFKGFVDLIVRGIDKRGKPVIWICDYKSCSWGWPAEKRMDRHVHAQVMLYKYFFCKKFDLDPKLVRTAFILLKKSPRPGSPPVEWMPVSAGPVSVQRTLDDINMDIADMRRREPSWSFAADTRSCEMYGERCPYLGTDECRHDASQG